MSYANQARALVPRTIPSPWSAEGAASHPWPRPEEDGRPQLSIVVPVHDEADNIAPLLAEIHAALDGTLEYEILYVDDGSDDDTWQRLVAARAGDRRLRLARHARNCGQSAALHTGVRLARAPWIATLDGDGQNDPADIPRLLDELRASTGSMRLRLVTGHRRTRRDRWIRRVGSRVANAVRRRMLHDDTPDTGCGLKLFTRDAFLALPYFDHMHRFLPALIQRGGGGTRSVPVSHRPRRSGRSHYGTHDRLWVGIADLFGVMWLARRARDPTVLVWDAASEEHVT